jgi:hypothetical protein
MERHPGEEEPGAAPRGRLDGLTVEIGLDTAEKPHPEHGAASVLRPRRGVNTGDGAVTAV